MNRNKILNYIIIMLCVMGTILMLMQKESATGLTASGLSNFKFFTALSNEFCSITAVLWLLMGDRAGEKTKRGLITLKLVAASSVGLTFAIIAFLLGPLYGHSLLYRNANFIFHLILPLVAMTEFVLLDMEDDIPLKNTMLAMIPTYIFDYC